MEKFQISENNLNNIWIFIEIYAVFVLNLYEEKSVRRKNDMSVSCTIQTEKDVLTSALSMSLSKSYLLVL